MYSEHPWTAHYEEGVPTSIDIPAIPLHQVLHDSAAKYPNNIAVRMVLKYLPLGLVIQARMTYSELDKQSNRFAHALIDMGVKPGDRVAVMLPNLPETVVAFYGILKAGGIVVNTNPTYTPRELHHQLADSGAETIIIMSGLYQRLQQIRDQVNVRNVIVADVPDSLSWPFNKLVERQVRSAGQMADVPEAADIHRFDSLLKSQPSSPPNVKVALDDPVLFQYTGGTTGVPKAAMLTHHNLVGNSAQMDAWFAKIEYGKERTLFALPAFHVYGMTVAMLFTIFAGSELVIVPDPRNTSHILDVIQNEKVTLYPGVPAMYIGIINHPKVQEYNLRSIKACLSGGSALPVEVAQQFEEITGGRLVEGFGMTETSPVTHANPIYGERRIGSIGLPLPNTGAQIISLEPDEQGEFTVLPVGDEGELRVRGPQVMKGYWGRDDETAKTLNPDGWLHTGDIAKMDDDGYFYIVDRKKDLIIAGGYNIVPREVEEVLFAHPAIMEAAVIGSPHPKRGETVKAFIVLGDGKSATQEEIDAYCRENLAPYKVPRLYEFRDELPKTQIGKVLRRELVQEEKERYESEQG
ncbi:MAG: long-chain fatty acid--CoA ligase [Caldilineaceae bacterium]|nr:long-chain fatty acid--CoA ligase [Caldilineaceae bacterium]